MQPAIVAAMIAAAVVVLPWPATAAWRVLRGQSARRESEIERVTARCDDLETLVDLLRKALDKHLIRESAVASAAELLIAIVGMVPDPSPAMLHLRDRAQQLLEDARAHTFRIDGGTK